MRVQRTSFRLVPIGIPYECTFRFERRPLWAALHAFQRTCFFFFGYWSPSEQGSAIEMQAFQVAWTEKAGTLPRARGQHVNQGHPFAVDDRRPPAVAHPRSPPTGRLTRIRATTQTFRDVRASDNSRCNLIGLLIRHEDQSLRIFSRSRRAMTRTRFLNISCIFLRES